ncbi:hypothetical protein KR038_001182 [Drosophila bunnanda]|nr:hypothetical protein KR038_001182 [Drosophila bunnanda]
MGGTTHEKQNHENLLENVKQMQKRKSGALSQEIKTKRAPLGDLQNRVIAVKDAAQKESKDLKLANTFQNDKASIDKNYKKEPLGTSDAPKTKSLSSKRLNGLRDIDANDKDNVFLVSEYVNDIYDYLYQVEEQQPIFKDHLVGQQEISPQMRMVLINWLNAVHVQFHLTTEAFQLAVAIIDRYLQVVKDTKRTFLQLVGVTALFIASKYEVRKPVAIENFVLITDNTYTARQICQMELLILKTIDYNLSRPLPIQFLRRYSKAAAAKDEQHAMAKYFIELAALDYGLSSYKPSEIAAASLFLSLNLLNGDCQAPKGFKDHQWSATLSFYSRYSAAHLRPISGKIAKLARGAPQAKMKAVYSKYQNGNFHKIALRPELSSPLLDSIIVQSQGK